MSMKDTPELRMTTTRDEINLYVENDGYKRVFLNGKEVPDVPLRRKERVPGSRIGNMRREMNRLRIAGS